MITVFTPTYNRKKELERLYQSLLTQKCKDFEWLIVDDGSTDQTEEYIEELKQEKKVCIQYYKVENGGKSKAFNYGVQKANGDCFLCIDSDDYLVDNILEKIEECFQKIEKNEEIAGIGFLTQKHGKDEIIGTKFPEDVMTETYTDIYYKYKVTGDKQLIYKTKILKEYPFPLVEKERFIAEAIVFNRISKKYKMVFYNIVSTYKEYMENGYSANYFNLVKKNPKGNMLYLKELYEINHKLYDVAAFDLFGIYAKEKWTKVVKQHPNPVLATLLYPIAWIKYKQKGS